MGAASTNTAKARRPNPLDERMTKAQIARRRFKAGLPRKLRSETLTIGGALGETFTLLDTFRSLSPSPDETILAALAFHREKGTDFAEYVVLPNTPQVAPFCEAVYALAADKPKFLGLIFVHVDPETENPEYQTVSFGVPLLAGSDAAARLRAAQHSVLSAMLSTLHGIAQAQQSSKTK